MNEPTSGLETVAPTETRPLAPGPALYLSRRLDWFTVPADDVDAWAPVVLVGPSPYYRLTPDVFTWFERALLAKTDDRATAQADREEIARTWRDVVVPHAEAALPVAAVKAARLAGGQLPPVPVLPDLGDGPRAEPPRHLAPMKRAG